MTTLAFDVYGTLINTFGMVGLLQRYIGEQKAMPFATMWRDKQLEYAFRRSMMNDYEPFFTCTTDALNYCIEAFEVSITRDQHFSLIKSYHHLPAYKEVHAALESMSERSDLDIYALTNGPHAEVEKLFEMAGINHYFKDIVSVDEIQKYKPDPAVYKHFLDRSGASKEDTWLVSSNSFDVIGASTYGLNSIWVKRSMIQQIDPWGAHPEQTVTSLSQIESLF